MPDNLFTAEQLQLIADALKPVITEVASKAAADHVTKRNKSFEDKFETFTQSISSLIKPSAPVEQDEEKLTLTQRITKQEEDNKKLRAELKAEKEASFHKSMRSSLEQKLLAGGIPAPQLKAVIAQLIHEDKAINIDGQGNATFKLGEETLNLEEGISNWLQTEGKAFIPSITAKGTQARTISRTRLPQLPSNGFQDVAERDEALDAILRTQR